MGTLWKDIRFAVRILLKKPGFTAVVALTLALGIGANTAIFSVVDGVVLRQLPYEQPEQLVAVWNRLTGFGLPRLWFSEPEYLDYRDQNTVFQNFTVYANRGANLTGTDRPFRVSVGYVTSDFFPMLRAKTAMGRVLSPEDDQPGVELAAVLSHGFWQEQMGGASDALGKKLTLDGRSVQVIGVLKPDFRFQEVEVDVWLPMQVDPANLNSRGSHYMLAFARLEPGVTLEQAQAEMDAIASRLEEAYPDNYKDAGWGTFLAPIQEEVVGEVRPALLLLLAAVGFVLLIACANVANLMLVRGASRVREMAVRAALGASRRRMLSQLLTESALLALLGGGLGLALAYAGLRALQAFNPGNIPRLADVAIDARVLGFTLAVSIFTGVIFGVVPAFQAACQDPNEALKDGGRDLAAGTRRGLLKSLTVAEVAISLALLAGAGLMVRGFSKLTAVDPGFRTDSSILTFRTALPSRKYEDITQRTQFYERLLEGLRGIPGVQSAGAISNLPLSGSYTSGTVTAESPSPSYAGEPDIEADLRAATPGYFETMGIELVAGRFFKESDRRDAPFVVVVDSTFKDRFWPEEDAIGKRIKLGGGDSPSREIVGVVRHVRHYGPQELGREQVYMPYPQRATLTMFTTVRGSGDPGALLAAARAEVARLDPEIPLYGETPLSDFLSEVLAAPRFSVLLVAAFAALALLLAAIGVYGVLAYSVSQRVHEIGIRMALGAGRGDIRGLVLREALFVAGLGALLGTAGALLLTRLMSAFLYGVSPADPWTYAAALALLAALILAAALVPIRRAARVDPMKALRCS